MVAPTAVKEEPIKSNMEWKPVYGPSNGVAYGLGFRVEGFYEPTADVGNPNVHSRAWGYRSPA